MTSTHTIKTNVAAISIFASAGMAAAKIRGRHRDRLSRADLGSLHSSVDVVATVITWLVVRVSDQPADEEHHYGHGKFESLSALFVIALLYVLAAASWSNPIAACARAHRPDALGHSLRRAGDRYRCQFLARAGAASHGARDPKPGAGGRRAAFRLRRAWFDRGHRRAGADRPRLCLGRLGRRHRRRRHDIDPRLRLGRSTIETLPDRAPEGASEKAAAAIRSVPGVVGVERVRVRMVGPTHFIDVDCQSARTYPIGPRRGDQENRAEGRQRSARRRRPDSRGAGRARQ